MRVHRWVAECHSRDVPGKAAPFFPVIVYCKWGLHGNRAWKEATCLRESPKERLQCVQSTPSQYPSPRQGADFFQHYISTRNGHWLAPKSSIWHIFSVSRKYVRRTEIIMYGSHAIGSLAWLVNLIEGDMQSKGVSLTAKSVLDLSFRFVLGLMEWERIDHAMKVSSFGKSWLWSNGMNSTMWSSWIHFFIKLIYVPKISDFGNIQTSWVHIEYVDCDCIHIHTSSIPLDCIKG